MSNSHENKNKNKNKRKNKKFKNLKNKKQIEDMKKNAAEVFFKDDLDYESPQNFNN
jgi:hypothetical protein